MEYFYKFGLKCLLVMILRLLTIFVLLSIIRKLLLRLQVYLHARLVLVPVAVVRHFYHLVVLAVFHQVVIVRHSRALVAPHHSAVLHHVRHRSLVYLVVHRLVHFLQVVLRCRLLLNYLGQIILVHMKRGAMQALHGRIKHYGMLVVIGRFRLMTH